MENKDMGMTFIVKTITKLTAGFIMIFGIFTALNGHSGPGGGFAGGVIIALAFVNLVFSFGKNHQDLKDYKNMAVAVIAASMLIFLVLSSFSLFGAQNAILPQFCELAVMIFVASGLYLVFLVLVNLISKRGNR